jgi:hypothetical protein
MYLYFIFLLGIYFKRIMQSLRHNYYVFNMDLILFQKLYKYCIVNLFIFKHGLITLYEIFQLLILFLYKFNFIDWAISIYYF